jgi:hypothetical protein
MKFNFTAKVALATLLCFVLAAVFHNMAGEEQMQAYGKNVIHKYFNVEDLQKRHIEERFSLGAVSELQVKGTSLDIRIERSPDQELHVLYTRQSDEEVKRQTQLQSSASPVTEGSVMQFNLDHFISQDKDIQLNLSSGKNGFGLVVNDSKVVLQVPSGIQKIRVGTVSGQVKILDQKLEELQVVSVSGDCKIDGDIKSIKIKTVSGDVKFTSYLAAPTAKIQTTSGDVKVVFKKSPDINVKFASTSGEIKIKTGSRKTEVEGQLKDYKLGDGTSELQIETTSGDAVISEVH